ncbi:MAG TPA: pitrilysin family protein [Candidatus Baltobacteraceae bacterium]|nr:pitrilysin family protein [Candidatus Baltobacteraceae bacterium]
MIGRILAGVMAGVFVFPQCAAAQNVPAASSGILQATLANGMRVVLLTNKLAPVTTTVMTYGAGSDDDTMPGLAHATEHMMFRGTADVSATQFAEMAARAGADYNAQTSNVSTTYYFKIPSAYTGLALRLEADRMTGALDREADWKTERSAIEQEVRAHQSVPGAALDRKLSRAFFGNTPYAQDGVGTIASFDKMHASDIAAFYHAWYHPNNATLVVAGDIDAAEVLAEIHRDFDPIPSVPLPAHKSYTVPPMAASTLSDTVVEMPVPVAASVYRFPDLRSNDFAASVVLAAVLQNSRGTLTDLQVQGKVLGAFAFSSAYPDVGVMVVAAAGLPSSSPASIKSDVEAALDSYRSNGVPPDLVAAAKASLLSTQDYQQASISGLAFSWADSLALGERSPDAVYANLQSVTPADVNRVLRTYMDPKNELTVLMTPKAGASVPHADANAATENVKVTPDKEEPLPQWAVSYFDAPLRVPQSDRAVRTLRLRNGLTLTVRPEHLSPIVVLRGYVQTSPDLYEPRGKDGVAQLTQALFPFGTTTYGRTEYDAQVDAIAANVKLGSSFGVTVQSKNFDRAVQLLADGMLHPAFPSQAFDVMQRNLARSLAAVEHEPGTLADIAQTNALYPPGDPRRRRPTAQTVAAIAPSDVAHWYHFAYRPDLTTIAVVGDITPDQAEATVERYFGAWRAPKSTAPSFEYPHVKASSTKSVTVDSATSTHSEVTLTQIIDVHSGQEDAIALELANTMLSDEGTGSLLFRDLRTEHGYVYDADSTLSVGENTSTFSIDFASDPKNVARAQASAIAEIRRLGERAVPDIELQRAKALLLAERVLPLDSYGGIAGDILAGAKAGLSIADQDAFWGKLLRLTPQQVQAAVHKWIRLDHFARVIVAPGP